MSRLLLAAVSVALFSSCGLDRGSPPSRSAPALEVLAASSVGAIDPNRSDLRWYDPDRSRVVGLRDGRIEPLQDVAISTPPEALRAFDDGSFVILVDHELRLHPMGGAPKAVAIAPLEFVGLDGAGIDDFWFATWSLDPLPGLTAEYGACHVVSGAIERCVEAPNLGGFQGRMAVAADGSVYITDRDDGLYRLSDGAFAKIGTFDGGVTAFRRSGSSLLAITYRSGVQAIEGSTLKRLSDGFTTDVIGSADDYYLLSFDAESTKDSPSCSDSLLHTCPRRTLWSQYVVWHVVKGQRSEVGYENCTDSDRTACEYRTYGIGLDGADLVVLGNPLRRVPRSR